jgi:hypothetical protein
MKTRSIVVLLAVASCFLALGDGAQHFGKATEARVALAHIKPDDQRFEGVHDIMVDQRKSAAEDAAIIVMQIFIIFCVARWQPNKSLQATAAAPASCD